MEYYENGGGAVAQLLWSRSGMAKSVIPQSQLYSADHIDGDGDGMPDFWEWAYFGDTSVSSGGRAEDRDEDGLCDRDEYAAGTDPMDRASVLAVSGMMWSSGGLELTWQSAAGKRYAILRSTNLLNGFGEQLMSNIVAHPPLNTYTALLDRACGYYRVSVEP
jgi:hypothetical protein